MLYRWWSNVYYPINECLRDHTNKDEILGIKSIFNKDDISKNVEVTEELSLLEYVICLTNNAINFIRSTIKLEIINNTIECNVTKNSCNFLDFIQQAVTNPELRRQWIQMGEEDATNFLSNKSNVV